MLFCVWEGAYNLFIILDVVTFRYKILCNTSVLVALLFITDISIKLEESVLWSVVSAVS